MTKPAVFISSGREGFAVARELGRQLEATADVTLWPEAAFHPGKTVVESLTEVAARSDFAIFIVTADDPVERHGSRSRPRDNLIFELGFFAGLLGLSRTFVIVTGPGSIELPSDLAGALFVALGTDISSGVERAVAPAATAIRKAMTDIPRRRSSVVDYYSCFISYSWADKDFAARLHDDLQLAGVRCWLDAKDMRVGDRITEQIDRAIQAHDKVLLVLSEASAQSAWVQLEIRNALRLERERRKTVLFPLRLDNSVLKMSNVREFDELRQKYIADFSDWQDNAHYRRAFSQLVRDLAISASVESGRPS